MMLDIMVGCLIYFFILTPFGKDNFLVDGTYFLLGFSAPTTVLCFCLMFRLLSNHCWAFLR